jgi:hypothetical protein
MEYTLETARRLAEQLRAIPAKDPFQRRLDKQAIVRELAQEIVAPVDELLGWWIDTYLAKSAGYDRAIGTIRKHLIGSKLGRRHLVDVRPGKIEVFLQEKVDVCAPAEEGFAGAPTISRPPPLPRAIADATPMCWLALQLSCPDAVRGSRAGPRHWSRPPSRANGVSRNDVRWSSCTKRRT